MKLKRFFLRLAGFRRRAVTQNAADAQPPEPVPAHAEKAKATANDDEAISGAVLDYLFPRLGMGKTPNYLSVWVSHNYDIDRWKPSLDISQKRITDIRTWAEKLEDPCVRKHYMRWLNHYQRELDSAWDELKTHETEKRQNDYRLRLKQEETAVDSVKDRVPKPPPDVQPDTLKVDVTPEK